MRIRGVERCSPIMQKFLEHQQFSQMNSSHSTRVAQLADLLFRSVIGYNLISTLEQIYPAYKTFAKPFQRCVLSTEASQTNRDKTLRLLDDLTHLFSWLKRVISECTRTFPIQHKFFIFKLRYPKVILT